MMYPFMTLDDDTEIARYGPLAGGSVKAYIQTPDEKDGFQRST